MASSVVIRNLAEGDDSRIQALGEFHAKAFGARDAAVRAQEMQQHKASAHNTVPNTLLALDGNETAGSVRICEDDFNGLRPALTPWLATLYVLEAHRGKGIATSLAQGAAELVKGAGHTAIYLWASDPKLVTNLYEKLGFKTVEETPVPHGVHKGETAYIMKRAL